MQAARTCLQSERDKAARKLNGFHNAITEAIRTPSLKAWLEYLEMQIANLDAKPSEPAPSPLQRNPNLSELHRSEVTDLSDPSIRTRALEAIRGLIEPVMIQHELDKVQIGLVGALSVMIGLAQNDKSRLSAACSTMLVAGVGFEPLTFRL